MKLQIQAEQIHAQGKAAKSAVSKEKQIKDRVLDRAMELLKAREVLSSLKIKDEEG